MTADPRLWRSIGRCSGLAQPYRMSVPMFNLAVLHAAPYRLPEAEVAYGKRNGNLRMASCEAKQFIFLLGLRISC
jgi:hypothetical protein